MNKLIEGDRYRWTGGEKKAIVTVPQYRFMKAKRKSERGGIFSCFWRFRYKKWQRKYLSEVPSSVKMGPGVYIGHLGGILINKDVVIGKNVNILNGVLLGYSPARSGHAGGTPVIGDQVWIGTNAAIVGKVTIGDNVLIAPNAYVNFDMPSNSIVIGNPGKIIKSEHATEGYCNNLFWEKE